MKRFLYRQERPIHGTTIGLSVKSHWKCLPPVLHRIKDLDLSIQKAKYWDNWTTMYLKGPHQVDVTDIFQTDRENIGYDMPLYHQRLPYNTCIYIYNISTSPYTVMDFGCIDRTGLFCEILEVLANYDVDVKGAYLNTIGNVVSNIFFITYRGKKLDDKYIEFLRNNLEFEMRNQEQNSY